MSRSINPQNNRNLTKVFSTSGPNLVALAWTGDELSREQAQNGVNFDFEVKFDLEGQGQSPPKTIGIFTKVFYTYGPNLVILAWTGDELSRGQTWWRTEGRTQATTIPEGQYWPRVKIYQKWYQKQQFRWQTMFNYIKLHNSGFITFHYKETHTSTMPGHNLSTIHQLCKHRFSAGMQSMVI